MTHVAVWLQRFYVRSNVWRSLLVRFKIVVLRQDNLQLSQQILLQDDKQHCWRHPLRNHYYWAMDSREIYLSNKHYLNAHASVNSVKVDYQSWVEIICSDLCSCQRDSLLISICCKNRRQLEDTCVNMACNAKIQLLCIRRRYAYSEGLNFCLWIAIYIFLS